MGIQARVSSTEAIEAFRARLIVFISKAKRCVDSVSEEVRQTRSEILNDKKRFWESEIRQRNKVLSQAQQDLVGAPVVGNQAASQSVRKMAVNRAREKVAEAENKLKIIKKWHQQYDRIVDPGVKGVDVLGQYLTNDMQKAVLYLANIEKALDAYATAQVQSSGPVAEPTTTETAEPPAS